MRFLTLLLITLFLSSCSVFKVNEEAESVAKEYFKNRIEKERFPYELLSEQFLESEKDSSEWRDLIHMVDKANGKTVSYKLTSWQTSTIVNNNSDDGPPSGKNVQMVFTVKYENGVGIERIMVNKPFKGKTFKIVTLYYNSKMLQDFANQSIIERPDTNAL